MLCKQTGTHCFGNVYLILRLTHYITRILNRCFYSSAFSVFCPKLEVCWLRVVDSKLREKFRVEHEWRGCREASVRLLHWHDVHSAALVLCVLVFCPHELTLPFLRRFIHLPRCLRGVCGRNHCGCGFLAAT